MNADDFGLRITITDAIVRCFDAGAVTSATAMVFMEDSQRAAEHAVARGLPVGLHLNLTFPFTGSGATGPIADRQERLTNYFASRRNRWRYDRRMAALVDDAIHDQLHAFTQLFGSPPTHVDGHHHIQTCPTVSASPALDGVSRLRPGHSGLGRRGLLADTARRFRDRRLHLRFDTPDLFYDFRQLHPAWGGPGVRGVLDAASVVEVMAHPGRADEERLLLADEWTETLSGLPLGSYRDLPKRPSKVRGGD